MRLALALLILAALPAAAQLGATTTPQGALSGLTMDGIQVAPLALGLRLVKPGWAGAWATQEPNSDIQVQSVTAGEPWVLRATLPCEGKPCDLLQTIERTPSGLKLTYRLTPSADLPLEMVMLGAQWPVEGSAGAGRVLACDGARVTEAALPVDKPTPYHLLGLREPLWTAWLLDDRTGVKVEPADESIASVSFQDDREFNFPSFEAQITVGGPASLRAGVPFEFSVLLKPYSLAALEADKVALATEARSREVPLTSAEPLAINAVTPRSHRVEAFALKELDLDLHGTWDNPFDPQDVEVTALFTGPDGSRFWVPAFYTQDFESAVRRGATSLRAVGNPGWRVRFSPNRPGRWEVVVTARDRSGEVTARPVEFTCIPSTSHGFIRRSPDTPYYMQFDDGTPYYAVGENICWTHQNREAQYREWFGALGAEGGNYARLWIVKWNMGLEWTPGYGSGQFRGLGKYALDNAWELDQVMQAARDTGIYCMLALGYHGEVQDVADYFGSQCWSESPYNAANGGPCATVADFWTNPEARRYYRNKLRYFVARYGWNTNILSWEFWNEVTAPAPWVAEMARELRGLDPHRHLITTTYGYDEVWRLPELDYTQAHTYGNDEDRRTTVPELARLGVEHTTRWGKPYMTGEFGIDWKTGDDNHDPEGLGTSLHDGMWCSVMTRCFGAAAIWYWDSYVHPHNLYREFGALRRFVDTVDWPRFDPDFMEAGPLTVDVPAGTPWLDVRARGRDWWGKHGEGEVVIGDDGSVTGDFAQILFSDSKPDMKRPLRFRVTYPQPGTLTFDLETVSQGAVLHVRVDGEEVWSREFPAGPPGEGEYEATNWREEWQIWQSDYNTSYSVPIPAGNHVIEVENTGRDWASIGGWTFSGCRDPRYMLGEVLGLVAPELALAWIHDGASTWYNDRYGRIPGPVSGAHTELRGLADGRWSLEWWDTRQGAPITTTTQTSTGGRMPVDIPTFTRDIAVRLTPAP